MITVRPTAKGEREPMVLTSGDSDVELTNTVSMALHLMRTRGLERFEVEEET